MREIILEGGHSGAFDSWREIARSLLQQDVHPGSVCWRVQCDAQTNLLTQPHVPPLRQSDLISMSLGCAGGPANELQSVRVPREFLRLAASVACHSVGSRWDALYRVLFRLSHGEPSLLEVATDPEVHQLIVMDKAVRRDVHKMHAFVRFRAVSIEEQPSRLIDENNLSADPQTNYIAWYEPQHHIIQRATPFFVRRFASMRWSILTPTECAHWNGDTLQFTPGVSRLLAPKEDELEELWRSYYAHIFNPARVAVATMQAEMPQRFWKNLPEAQLISALKRDAPARVSRMMLQLHQTPAEIPDDLRSRVGDVLEPDRSRVGAQAKPISNLDVPGAWDPVHDPGVSAARARLNSILIQHATSFGIASAVPTQINPGDADHRVMLPATALVNGADVRVGTASWTDPTLLQRGVFYPDDVNTPEARLKYYASNFSLVEVDATYYVPPTRAMAAAWATRTPESFVFDIKAFALMTEHAAETKRMPDWLRRALPRSLASAERVYARDLPTRVVDDVWQRFLHALSPLRDAGKLGPILLQFPRWFAPSRATADVLRAARERLGSSSAAVEFRNPDWVTGRLAPRTLALLESLNLTYVIVDAPPGTRSSMPPIASITTPHLSVIRLHGRRVETWEAKNNIVSERYRYLYDSQQLSDWAHRIADVAEQLGALRTNFPDMAKAKQGVHVVFNNCHANYGTSNAIEITQTLIEFDKMRRLLR